MFLLIFHVINNQIILI